MNAGAADLESALDSIGRHWTREVEFWSDARAHVLSDSPRLLQRFDGRSSLGTYLHVVVRRLYVDWRRKRHGYWRPSAAARRAGPPAVRYETLTRRDRRPRQEALELLRSEGIPFTEKDAAELEQRLPNRTPRSFEPEGALQAVPCDGPAPDEEAALGEARAQAPMLEAAIRKAMQALPDEEKLMLRLRYLDGLTVRDIGAMLGIQEKPLFKRYDRLLLRLRASLVALGATPEQVLFAIGREGWDFEGALAPVRAAARQNHTGVSVSSVGDAVR